MKKKILLLVLLISIFLLGGCKSLFNPVKITPDKSKEVTYETFNNGLINVEVPKGWKVHVPTCGYTDYTFKVYNPDDPNYSYVFALKLQGFLKSEKARASFAKMYPSAIFGKIAAIDPQTTEAFYKVWYKNAKIGNEQLKEEYFPYLKDFSVIENLGKLSIGGDILRATFKNDDGELMQGIFTASVVDSGSYYMYGKDFAPLNVYHTIMMMAPDSDFVNWQSIYDHSIGTLSFTEGFMKGFRDAENTMVSTVQANQKVYDQISDMIMDSWNKRSDSYDRISQKQSDATLGYERVYDTSTGDIYKASNGFMDNDWNGKYELVTDDMYSKPISGYIERVN